MLFALLLLLLHLAVVATASTHRATWINVWLNANQKYVPNPVTGRASNNITCAWDVAAAKYNISLPPNMTLANTAAIDWTGGENYGNMYAYIALIQRAGIDTLIPDFTNGFGMSNSKFPVEQLHHMLRTHFPSMRVAYAVSSAAFKGALDYLNNTASDTFGYLTDAAAKPVFVLYTAYDQYLQIKQAHTDLRILFADGESTAANKAGWHKVPYSGYSGVGGDSATGQSTGTDAYNADEVFWVAPSLDWQPGPHLNASWSLSLPWLAWGLHTLDALPAQPWLTVMGSFDDAGERNMWMPALTRWATAPGDAHPRDNSMFSLDGVPDAGVASTARNDWTVFYDTVSAYFTQGRLPRGQTREVTARVPTGVGEFMLGRCGASQQTEAAYTLYVNPPFPYNNGVGASISGHQRPAFVRSVSSVYPPGLLFPSAPANGTNNSNNAPLLQEFSFQSGLSTTRPVKPLHMLSCTQCGLAVCSDMYALNVLPGTYLTTSGTLVLPDMAGVDYPSAVDVHDCDLLRGPGVAFVTSSNDDSELPSHGTGIVAVPLTYSTQSLVYSVPQPDGRVILYAQATGELFAATSDFTGVEMRRLSEELEGERHLWMLTTHPASKGASVVSTVDGKGNTVAWHAAVDQAPVVCAQGGDDCLYAITLVQRPTNSLLTAFVFRDV